MKQTFTELKVCTKFTKTNPPILRSSLLTKMAQNEKENKAIIQLQLLLLSKRIYNIRVTKNGRIQKRIEEGHIYEFMLRIPSCFRYYKCSQVVYVQNNFM